MLRLQCAFLFHSLKSTGYGSPNRALCFAHFDPRWFVYGRVVPFLGFCHVPFLLQMSFVMGISNSLHFYVTRVVLLEVMSCFDRHQWMLLSVDFFSPQTKAGGVKCWRVLWNQETWVSPIPIDIQEIVLEEEIPFATFSRLDEDVKVTWSSAWKHRLRHFVLNADDAVLRFCS